MDGRWVEWPELPSGQQWRKSAGPWATLPNSAPPTPLQQVLTREPNRAGAPIQPPRLSCCSNMFCEGAVLRGGVATLAHPPPSSWEKATAARLDAPPANKAPASESEQPIVTRAASWGTGAAPQGPGPASRTPNTCSRGLGRRASSPAPRGGGGRYPVWKEFDPIPEKGLIQSLPPHLTRPV